MKLVLLSHVFITMISILSPYDGFNIVLVKLSYRYYSRQPSLSFVHQKKLFLHLLLIFIRTHLAKTKEFF